MLKKQTESNSLFQFFKKTANIDGSSEIVQNESTSNSSTVFENPVAAVKSNNDLDITNKSVDRSRMESNDSGSIFSSPSVDTSIGSSASVEMLNTKMDEVSETSKKILSLLQSLDLQSAGKSQTSNQKTLEELRSSILKTADDKIGFEGYIELLKTAKSMESVMGNKLINGIFHFAHKDEHGYLIPIEDSCELDETDSNCISDDCYLLCQLCKDNFPYVKGIRVQDKSYSRKESDRDTQEDWFITMKKVLVRHLVSKKHSEKFDDYENKVDELHNEIDNIKRTIRYFIYYLLRTNTAFIRLPELLAVAYQCGLNIGNINHSKDFPAKILPLVDGVLLEKTADWLKYRLKLRSCLGYFEYCQQSTHSSTGVTNIDTQTDGSKNQGNRTLLAQTMNYVQTESKIWRSGIHFTDLVLSSVDFMRPKVFSSTRMSLYEYEQIHRFLEVKHYFDIPWHYEILCQLYVFILLALKIMLKTCQKTNDQRDYIKRVFLGAHGNEPEGKVAMHLCLRVAKDVIRSNDISYLTQSPQIDLVGNNPLDNKFVEAVLNLWTSLGAKLVATSLVNPHPLT